MPQCPVCSTEYIQQETTNCLICAWDDLTPYLSNFQLPEEFIQKYKANLAWAKRVWSILPETEKHKLCQVPQTHQKQIPQQTQPQKQVTQTSTQKSVQVFEFSREFINLVFKNDKWVSGGFGSEIGLFNCLVPQKIQDAVNRGDFRINDNYPPKENEYALIAREIDEYSVLAVVTRLEDNRSRFCNAYRYFWLEKIDKNIDGIGTLLVWWIKSAGEPKFDPQWNPNTSNLNYNARCYSHEECYQYFQQSSKYFYNILTIRNYPEVFVSRTNDIYSSYGLHYLALDAKRKYNHIPISWAWNVNGLENPEMFLLICCADKQGYEINVRNLIQHRKLLSPAQPAPPQKASQVTNSSVISQPQNLNQRTNQPLGTSNNTVNNTSNKGEIQKSPTHQPRETAYTSNEQSFSLIKTHLSSISLSDEQRIKTKLTEIANLLVKYPNITWRDNNFTAQVIENSRKNYNAPGGVVYIAILAILGNIPIPEWLTQLKLQNNTNYEKDALKIQKMFLDISSHYATFSKQLENNIYLGIIDLLLELQKSNNKNTATNIDWLLIRADGIWKEYFKNYAHHLFTRLIKLVPQNSDNFYNLLYEKLDERQAYRERNGHYQGFILTEYKSIAMLFKQVGHYSLSALFYQLSDGNVPPDIYDKVKEKEEIIDIIRDESPSIIQKNVKNIQNLFSSPFNQFNQ